MIKKKNQMKVNLYASNHHIKTIKVPKGTNVFNEVYVIRVWFKKYIFGSNFVKIVVRPDKLLKNDENEIHVTVKFEQGVEL